MSAALWLPFGVLTRAHGVRGELRLVPCDTDTPLPGDVERVRVRPRGGAPRLYSLAAARRVHEAYIVRLQEIESREEAQALAGAELDIERALLGAPGPGEIFVYELEGAVAEDEAGESLGQVRAVLDNRGQSLLSIDTPAGEKLLPLVPETLVRFDRQRRAVVVKVPQGLWDEDTTKQEARRPRPRRGR